MNTIDKNLRSKVAALVEDFYRGKIDYKELSLAIPENNSDKDIQELLDLIEHEPKVGGLLGVSQEEHRQVKSKIDSIVEKLKLTE